MADEQAEQKATVQTPTFDVRACSILHEAHALIHATCPEVRSISSTLDYFGNLNDAQIQKGIWTSANGPVTAADGIMGSLFQTLRLVEEQFAQAVALAVHLRERVQQLSTEAMRLQRDHDHEVRKEEAEQAALDALRR